jgi:hypothetical protein
MIQDLAHGSLRVKRSMPTQQTVDRAHPLNPQDRS